MCSYWYSMCMVLLDFLCERKAWSYPALDSLVVVVEHEAQEEEEEGGS